MFCQLLREATYSKHLDIWFDADFYQSKISLDRPLHFEKQITKHDVRMFIVSFLGTCSWHLGLIF